MNKKSILVVASHPDDEVLGCGGTIAKHVAEGHRVTVVFMTNGESSRSEADNQKNISTRNQDCKKALSILGVKDYMNFDFPDNMMDQVPLLEVVKSIEDTIQKFRPSIIYTHFSDDLNIDHRITHEAVLTACRPQSWSPVKSIFLFEVLSATEWNSNSKNKFNPNKFIDISNYWPTKHSALNAYRKELRPFPHSRNIKTIKALAVYRGATVGFKKAEAFQVERILE